METKNVQYAEKDKKGVKKEFRNIFSRARHKSNETGTFYGAGTFGVVRTKGDEEWDKEHSDL